MGQVDCCWVDINTVYVGECKSGCGHISAQQYQRLVSSSLFVAHLFNKRTKLVKVTLVAKMNREHYHFSVNIIKEFAA